MIDDDNEEFEPEMGVPIAGHAALQIPDYRRLLSARFLVTIALQIQSLAVGWQVYELTKNPLFLGLIGLAEIIPAIGVSLYAGHVADVPDRRRIALTTVLMLACCVLVAPFTAASWRG